MRVAANIIIKNATVVQSVNPYFSVGMNNVIVLHNYAHVGNFSFIVIKKSQIARFTFLNKAQGLSLGSLLAGIAQQFVAIQFIDHLGKTATIYAEGRFAAP